jgi:hypothetical protein
VLRQTQQVIPVELITFIYKDRSAVQLHLYLMEEFLFVNWAIDRRVF